MINILILFLIFLLFLLNRSLHSFLFVCLSFFTNHFKKFNINLVCFLFVCIKMNFSKTILLFSLSLISAAPVPKPFDLINGRTNYLSQTGVASTYPYGVGGPPGPFRGNKAINADVSYIILYIVAKWTLIICYGFYWFSINILEYFYVLLVYFF